MKSLLIALTILPTTASAAAPQHGPWERYAPSKNAVPVVVVGYSTESCATVVNGKSGAQELVSKFYSWGIWSGLNMGLGLQVGSSTDSAGIWGEVKLECANHPAESLVAATTAVYYRFKNGGR